MVPRYPAPPASAARPTVLRGSPGPRGTLGHLLRCLRAACVGALLAAASPDASAGNADVEALRQRIETLRTEGDARIGAGSAAARAMVASLYERRGFAPLWDDARRVRLLLAAIEASATHGLDPRDYHADLLVRPQAAERVAPSERDLLLTDAFMRLAYHLVFGKADPRALQNGWNFSRSLDGVDPDAALAALLAAPDPAAALEDLAPRLPTYRDLRRALAQLREIEQRGGWSPLEGGPKLEPGATGRRVVQLRARLLASGDLVASSTEAAAFDRELEAALRRFQARHGLEIDGVVGPQTLGALNVGVAERIAQVRANLERLRWVARDLAGDYLLVDIAGFAAQLWLDDMPAWSARVVVGKPFRKTPEFRATMKYLVLNPEWSVPPTILREDVLPKVVKDPGYLQRHDMRLLAAAGRTVDPQSIDWSSYRNRPREFPFQIVQSAGPDNPLGRVKFMFPNEFSVYLHDTPTRALFEKTVRAFSSGCIRIENPLALAQLLLDDPERWSEQQLLDAIAAGKTATVPVRRSVPVLLLYFTAVGGDGDVQFRRDLYNRDGPIIDALAAPFRFAPIDRGRRAAAAR
jgi:murein L,D-transpeptidase YcbB/YkuD